MSDTTVITQTEVLGLLQCKYRLRLEIDSGLKFKQSTLAAVNRLAYRHFPEVGPKFFHKKKDALEWVEAILSDIERQQDERAAEL